MDIHSIEFASAGQMKITVQMPETGRFTTYGLPHLPRRLFQLFPQLSKHKCDNDYGYSFKRECQDTELPHLLEHLIIELQSMAHPRCVLRGQTVWDWRKDPRGCFHVYVDYRDQVVAIAAARLAVRIIKAIDAREVDLSDIEAEVRRLVEMARLSREMDAALPMADVHSWEARTETVTSSSREAVPVPA